MNASLTPNQQKLVCNHFTYNTVKPCQTYKLLEFLTIAIYDPVICKEKFRSKKKGKKEKKKLHLRQMFVKRFDKIKTNIKSFFFLFFIFPLHRSKYRTINYLRNIEFNFF